MIKQYKAIDYKMLGIWKSTQNLALVLRLSVKSISKSEQSFCHEEMEEERDFRLIGVNQLTRELTTPQMLQ